jgi:serine/threonine protein kinase
VPDDRDDRAAAEASRTSPERAPAPEVVEPAPLVAGMVLAGRYEIREAIGRGGMGVVVRAHDRVLGQPVAIKILRAEYAGERQWSERLAREVRLARQIHHPNVCRVFDFEQADGRVFLVMELAGGGTLRDEIVSGAVADRPLVARLADARAIGEGLSAIHAAGIIHRDLSPQNLLRMSDGRLVISDFGLAIDTFESATSMRGGTVAYMAPEVVRGAAPSFAADIWSLGVVLHEAVFGVRPRWRDAASFEMLEPEIGRRLSLEEGAVLETCRMCTVLEDQKRVTSAGDVTDKLSRKRRWRRSAGSRGTRVTVGAILTSIVVVLLVAERMRSQPASRLEAALPPLIVPKGEPEDWSTKARVLAEVEGRIRCLVALPGGRVVRFLWGRPGQAQDLDLATGRSTASPIVSSAYAEGCPDLSADGQRLLFQGHIPDGRAFAYVSKRPDGADAVPVVQTAEPSMSSEPQWMANGNEFSYDVDARHFGIFSTVTNRTTVIPDLDPDLTFTIFRSTAPSGLVHASVLIGQGTEITLFEWPTLAKAARFRVPDWALDVRVMGRDAYAYSTTSPNSALIEVVPSHQIARAHGKVPEQLIRYQTPVPSGLVFVSIAKRPELKVRGPSGSFGRVQSDGENVLAAPCGRDIVAERWEASRKVIVKLNIAGATIGRITGGPDDESPVCSRDGATVFYIEKKDRWVIRRCDRTACRDLFKVAALGIALSPDDKRLAFIEAGDRGASVRWASTDGGPVRNVCVAETMCDPVWSSPRTLWVSRKREGKASWAEVDTDTGLDTGRTRPGATDCSSGLDDEVDTSSPADPDVRIDVRQVSQVRFLRGGLGR